MLWLTVLRWTVLGQEAYVLQSKCIAIANLQIWAIRLGAWGVDAVFNDDHGAGVRVSDCDRKSANAASDGAQDSRENECWIEQSK